VAYATVAFKAEKVSAAQALRQGPFFDVSLNRCDGRLISEETATWSWYCLAAALLAYPLSLARFLVSPGSPDSSSYLGPSSYFVHLVSVGSMVTQYI